MESTGIWKITPHARRVQGDRVTGAEGTITRAVWAKDALWFNVHMYRSHIPSPILLLGQWFLCNSKVYTNENMMNRLRWLETVVLASSHIWGLRAPSKPCQEIAVTPSRWARVGNHLNAPSPANCSPRTCPRAASLLLPCGLHLPVVVPAFPEHPLPSVTGRCWGQLSEEFARRANTTFGSQLNAKQD